MLLLVTLVLLVQSALSSSQDNDQVAWFPAPNYRGTWDLIISCILTLTICVWSALHLNVPPENSRLRDRNLMRLRWIVIGIFAPELVVSTAFAQYLTARWLQKEIRKDLAYRKENVSLPSRSTKHQRLLQWACDESCQILTASSLHRIKYQRYPHRNGA